MTTTLSNLTDTSAESQPEKNLQFRAWRIAKIATPILTLLVISFSASEIWTRGSLVYFWDEYLPLSPAIDLHLYSTPWLTVAGHGEYWPEAVYWWWMTAPFAGFQDLGLSIQSSLVAFYAALLFLSATGFYFMLPTLFRWETKTSQTYVARVFGSILYMNNFYVSSAPLNDNYVVWCCYALFPWAVYLILRVPFANSGNLRYTAHLGLIAVLSLPIAAVAVLYPPVALELVVVTSVLFLVVNRGSALAAFKTFVKLAALVIAVNGWQIYLILTQASINLALWSGSGGFSSAYSNLQASSASEPFLAALRYPSPLVGGVQSALGPNFDALVALLGFSIPLVGLSPLLFRQSRAEVTYLCSVLLFLFSVALQSGLSGPARPIYSALFVPGDPLIGFHDTITTFGFTSAFLSCILFGYGLRASLGRLLTHSISVPTPWTYKLKRGGVRRVGASIFLCAAISGMLLSQSVAWSPAAVPSRAGVSGLSVFPDYFWSLSNFLTRYDHGRMVLGLPVGATLMGVNWSVTEGGFIGPNPYAWSSGEPGLFTGEVPSSDWSLYYGIIYPIVTSSDTRNFSILLSALDVKFVVLQTTFIHSWPGGPPPFNISGLHRFLGSQDNLTEVAQFGPDIVYENKGATQMVGSGNPVYFSPTVSQPWVPIRPNESFFGSFPRLTNEVKLPNGTTAYFASSSETSSGLRLSIQYDPTIGASSRYMFVPSYSPLNVTARSAQFVIVNYTTSSQSAGVYLEASNATYGVSGHEWYFLHYFNLSDPEDYSVTSLQSSFPHSVAFELPAGFPIDLNFLGFGLDLSPSISKGNYSASITSVMLAQFVSPTQWPLYLLAENSSSVPDFVDQPLPPGELFRDRPTISVLTGTPTFFRVGVTNSTGPFLLTLAQTYSPGWHATFEANGATIGTHYMVDSYANGWLVHLNGSYVVDIRFNGGPIDSLPIYETYSGGGAAVLIALFAFISGSPSSFWRRHVPFGTLWIRYRWRKPGARLDRRRKNHGEPG